MAKPMLTLVAALALAFPLATFADDVENTSTAATSLPLYNPSVHDEEYGATAGAPIRIVVMAITMDYNLSTDEFYRLNPEWSSLKNHKLEKMATLGFFTKPRPTLIASN